MSGGPVGPVVPVRMIAAMARNGVMGKDGKLPWSIPEDLVWAKVVGLWQERACLLRKEMATDKLIPHFLILVVVLNINMYPLVN